MASRGGCGYLAPALAAVISLIVASRLQAATFFDDFSTMKAWGEVLVVGTGPFSVTYPATGGPTGGPYRETSFSFTSPGTYYLAHAASFSAYAPHTQGSIASLDFSFDGNDLNPAQGATAYHLLVYQNSTYYQGPTHIVRANSWAPFSDLGLTAASFTMVGSGPGPTHQDFSSLGSAMQFGYITAASSTANNGNTLTETTGIANWSVTINPGYFTVAPCRLRDTRAAGQGPALTAGSAQVLAVTGHCGVPAQAIAVSFNLTVVQPTTNAQLTVFPVNQAAPISTMPVIAGKTRASNAVVMLATNGQGTIAVLLDVGTTNVILDVAGYFQ